MVKAHVNRTCDVRRKTKTLQTNELMDVDKEDHNQSIMEAALETAPRDMVALVARRDQELKVRGRIP